MDSHNNRHHHDNHNEFVRQLHKLWLHADNKGCNIRIEGNHIRLTPGPHWHANPAHSFPYSPAGVKAARAWIDEPKATP